MAKKENVVLWSLYSLSKLMRAANCVQFGLNHFCSEVIEVCLHHIIGSSHQLELKVERPAQSTTFPFFAILQDKSTE